jgi:hypothetical protein
MTGALFLSLLWKIGPFILAAIGFLGYGKYKERIGAKKEIAKREAADRMVEDIADQVQSDVGSMSKEQIDAELRKRARG